MFLKRLLGALLLLFCFATGFAQTRSITGVVKNADDGTVIAGATITNLKTSFQTASNQNGEFKIDAASGDSVLFSHVGRRDQTVVVSEKSILEVVMYAGKSEMDEVTVVAFGKQKKTSVVGAVTTVSVEDLRIPSSNFTSSFAGRIPGMISFSPSGEPGADNAQFFIRGVTTFGYQASPLILIDGFESSTDVLARLQPDDIESFSILKDASATVLYGARGANGIIMVNTKSGKEGPVRLSARFDLNVSASSRIPKMLDGVSYMKLYNEARISRDPILGAYYSEQKIQSTASGENPMIFPNIDWYNTLFNQTTQNKKLNLNINGGGQVATYYVALGIDKESGLLKVDKRNNFNNNIDINRFYIRSNVIFKLTPTTKLDTRIQGRFERYNGPFVSATDVYNMVMNTNPVDFPATYEPDEKHSSADYTLFGNTYLGGGLKRNPYAEMVRGYEGRNESDITTNATLYQDLKFITRGLKLEARASVDTWSKYSGRRSYNPYYFDLESYNQVTGEYKLFDLNPNDGSPYLGNVLPGRDANGHYYFQVMLNYDRTFGRHNIGLMTVGMSDEKLLTAGNSNSIYETLPERNLGNSGRATYNYDNRYFFEFTYGYNGSEKFSSNTRFGFFPSFGGGYLVSNEDFWEPIKDVVSTLKFRGTWGLVGNDAIAGRSGRFFYLSDIELGGGAYRWGSSFMNAYPGYTINRYANPDITWELSKKLNLGMDLNLFKDAVKFQIDFYRDMRSGIYMQRQNFPSTAGLEASISGNVGKVSSKGFEAHVDYSKSFQNGLMVQIMGNFTYATNKLVEIDEKNYSDAYLRRLGSNINQQWGLVAERLFVDSAEIANSPKQDFGRYMAGDIKYKDVNGDGVINANDRVAMGYPTVPEIQYGFGASASFKNFDLNFFFQGNSRVSFFINAGAGDGGIAPFASRRNALALIADDHWSETNPNIHAFWPRLSTDPMDNNTQQSSWWLRDGSFLRLKKVEVGYSPPASLLKRIGISPGTRTYISTENAAVFTPFKLWDPEMGRNGLGYPPNRRFAFGIQVMF
ncbi:SusC/RagA family TonB-linked outer membrane protein [Niabella drilacis]|uniref:TonB-linked outer membrane protein, SusC/RagA family n=1 Tax=Niabella drilacis (strain DSM 25811 / CCM 8410 / CCUG 62505 / LMG 26954 / E90) TaxID=1285928 RepID=A0A1G7BE38_NIADE|nr:TonB-dependent receptor [Niabella drilacis]SDE25368.1 TonB-linked outer membrane protein, SusC/RagA family [Niabella drilacis]